MMTRRHMLASLLGLAGATLVRAQGTPLPTLAQTRWHAFSARFIADDGRVLDTGNAGISHTEGQGVAMLAAATLKDEAAFARLWNFTRTLRRSDDLFSWKFVPGTGIADANNATDGDLYIAWALARAAQAFPHAGYGEEAVRTARAIRKLCLADDPHGVVVLPGVQGFRAPQAGTATVVNPAYWVFPALSACSLLDPDERWQQCIRTGLEMLGYAAFGRFQLPADWLSLSDPVVPWSARPARFGYEAIRIPLFLVWAGQHDHPCLKRFAAYARSQGFPAWIGFDDKTKANYSAPQGFEAVANLARNVIYQDSIAIPDLDADYFSSSLSLLSALSLTDLKAS